VERREERLFAYVTGGRQYSSRNCYIYVGRRHESVDGSRMVEDTSYNMAWIIEDLQGEG
jgi:hypothetical protein